MKLRQTLMALCCLCTAGLAFAAESPRITPTVRLIEKVQGAVVGIFSQNADGTTAGGSGSIIHPDGFVLTAEHVVHRGRGSVLLGDQTVLPYRVVGRLPEKDLAIIKVDSNEPLKSLPLGYSEDLKAGEPVLVGGNPGGRGIVFSSGIVNAPAMLVDAPNALVMTYFIGDVRDRFIQFDATSNAGNSGGPLINAEGKLIGIVARKFSNEQNINFAIPVDRLRRYVAEMIAPEEVNGSWIGLRINALTDRPSVESVEPNSPAASADLRAGDVLLSVNEKPVQNGVDWILAISESRRGSTFNVAYERDGTSAHVKLTATEYPLTEPVSPAGKKPKLHYTLYHERVNNLQSLRAFKPVASGVTADLAPEKLAGARKDYYVLVFEGFLQVPESGPQRLLLSSDDGSRLFLDGRLLVDNDGFHPPQEMGRIVRLAAGLHPIRIEYFQARGDAVLQLRWQREGSEPQPITADMLWHE